MQGSYGTTGSSNSIFGAYAGNDITDGGPNSAFGVYSLSSLTSGDHNTGLGANTLTAITTQNYNSAIGSSAMQNATGANSVAVGADAGKVNTSTGSIFIGFQSGISNTSGQNLVIGYQALNTNTTGTFNTAIGYQAGDNVTGSNNTLIGHDVADGLTSGSNNTFIGVSAGNNATTTSGSIKIGYEAGANDNTANVLFIDNSNTATPLIFGDFTGDSILINGVLAATGIISGATGITLDTDATITLTASDCKNRVRINDDANAIDYTLPSAVSGLAIVFYDIAGGVITVDANTGDVIYLNGTALDAGDSIDSPGAVGNFICLMAIDATRWITMGRSGVWIDGGP
jgi:hypothetical protein